MVLTLPLAKAAFNHILDVIFECGNGTPLKTALKGVGITDIYGLITITPQMIHGLTYEDPHHTGRVISVPRGSKNLILIFCDYIAHCHNTGNPIDDNWTSITQEQFDIFCLDPTYISIVKGSKFDETLHDYFTNQKLMMLEADHEPVDTMEFEDDDYVEIATPIIKEEPSKPVVEADNVGTISSCCPVITSVTTTLYGEQKLITAQHVPPDEKAEYVLLTGCLLINQASKSDQQLHPFTTKLQPNATLEPTLTVLDECGSNWANPVPKDYCCPALAKWMESKFAVKDWKDIPVNHTATCGMYHSINIPKWDYFRTLPKCQKKFKHLADEAKLRLSIYTQRHQFILDDFFFHFNQTTSKGQPSNQHHVKHILLEDTTSYVLIIGIKDLIKHTFPMDKNEDGLNFRANIVSIVWIFCNVMIELENGEITPGCTFHAEPIFGESPKQVYTFPIEKGDHPELDSSEFVAVGICAEQIIEVQSTLCCLGVPIAPIFSKCWDYSHI